MPTPPRRSAESLRASGAQAIARAVDVSDRTAVDRAFDEVRAELGPIEILVTSAAISGFVPFEAITLDDWSRTIAVNLTGHVQLPAGRDPRHGGSRVGSHRHDLVGGRPDRFGAPRRTTRPRRAA